MVAKVLIDGGWRPVPDVLALLNHPGHSSQKSHGRKGLAGQTTAEIGAAASTAAKEITGRDISFDFDGSDPDVARDHAEGILRGLEEFPGVAVTHVGTYGPGGGDQEAYAFTRGSEIYFNNRYGSDPDFYDEMLSGDGDAGALTAATRQGVALHEFGHVLVEQSGSFRGQVAGAAYDSAVSQAKQAGATGSHVREFIAEGVSDYASTSVNEYAAEAFADVMWNGSRASPLSRSGYDIAVDSYRKTQP